jgi:TonB-linked SusC/RagA family outer membrane protein
MMRNLYKRLGLLTAILLTVSMVSLHAQSSSVSGTIIDESGSPIPGVSVLEKGTTNGTTTDTDGKYTISVGANATLVFSFIGYTTVEMPVNGRSSLDVSMNPDVTSLQEVIVTGYTTERKKDIIGSVAVVNPKTTLAQPTANLSSMLQGRAAGVTVSGTGAPGAAAKVRIRGFVSFGNNDPLYVIDGVPTDNANSLNPQDVESIQVLKDPVSASIYGSRAANGVIVITTKTGKSGKHEISYDGYYGSQSLPERSYPKMLNTQQYADMLWSVIDEMDTPPATKSGIFGNGSSPVIPSQLWTSMNVNAVPPGNQPVPANYEVFENINPDNYGPYQIYNTSPGTDWHREITRTAPMHNHQITATGGSENAQYSLGFNYFDQEGVFKYTDFNRYSVRLNTRFTPKKWLTIGQNLQLSYTKQYGSSGNPQDFGGGLDFSGEGGAWAQAYRMVPYIPVYDINGNWGGNGVGDSGNGTNPVAGLWRNRNNQFAGFNFFGNAYARINFLKDFTFSTSFGFDQRVGNGGAFTYITYERSENQKNNAFNEFFFRGGSWTWTNSLQYNKTIADKHVVKVFAAVESVLAQFRSLSGARQDYLYSDENFTSINTGTGVQTNGGQPSTPNALYSIFGKAEYQFDERYLMSVTLRRDGSSVFGPENRYATFPAFGAGWRISEEAFMQNVSFVTDLKLRGGWGQMGSQRNVPAANAYTFYYLDARQTGYDISGNNGNVVVGYRPAIYGNPSTRWETATMWNIGFDAALFDGKVDFTLEYFNNTTSDLLVDRQRNGLEPVVTTPKINVGTMVNKGIDGSVAVRGNIGGTGITYDAAITYTSYKNEATKLDADGVAFFEQGGGRLAAIQRTEKGQALSTFWGWQVDGIFQNQAEVDAHADMPYKEVGTWKIRDINNDGVIDSDDRTYLGSPIPKFQLGTDLTFKFKGFDLNAFFYWNYGNKIYNYTKWWTDLRGFVGGVSERVATESWSETNPGGTLPKLAPDTYSGSISNSYYVESGSYFRLRQLQLGYTVPESFVQKIGLSRARIYVQGQNVFTVTDYSGPDPDINIQGDELAMGVDQFRTPSPKIYLVGISLGF